MHVQFSIRHIPLDVDLNTKRRFTCWLIRAGWLPYDHLELWINLNKRRRLEWIDKLFEQYKTAMQ